MKVLVGALLVLVLAANCIHIVLLASLELPFAWLLCCSYSTLAFAGKHAATGLAGACIGCVIFSLCG